jgi:hypothetical protein
MAKVPKLDRLSDDVGIVCGGHNGAQFTKDRHYYDHEGNYLFSEEGVEPPAKVAEEPVEDKTPANGEANDDEGAAGEELDLAAWAAGEATYQWFKVKAAILERYNVSVENKEQALAVIADPPQE